MSVLQCWCVRFSDVNEMRGASEVCVSVTQVHM